MASRILSLGKLLDIQRGHQGKDLTASGGF